jgi:hypothetical protein
MKDPIWLNDIQADTSSIGIAFSTCTWSEAGREQTF